MSDDRIRTDVLESSGSSGNPGSDEPKAGFPLSGGDETPAPPAPQEPPELQEPPEPREPDRVKTGYPLSAS